jgi:hypothetical protein
MPGTSPPNPDYTRNLDEYAKMMRALQFAENHPGSQTVADLDRMRLAVILKEGRLILDGGFSFTGPRKATSEPNYDFPIRRIQGFTTPPPLTPHHHALAAAIRGSARAQ